MTTKRKYRITMLGKEMGWDDERIEQEIQDNINAEAVIGVIVIITFILLFIFVPPGQ